MLLEVKRLYKKDTYTIGVLMVDGEKFSDTLEDKVRDLKSEKKVYGETAIPAGKYKVVMSMSSKFKRVMPYLENVPQFTGIMIHPGNTIKDTLGCILVGENMKKGQLVNSRKYSDELNKRINEAIERKEQVWIEVDL
jgi:hypothetical protein|uniref:DUF5675 domain-containing protein n=1 Tax=Ackermannviridae sp. ctClB2 TaxID=2825752 RepID=A0A8S5P0I1_9CAUD|nr:MAG TPA: hypothetical protein [Ackermannviridae sp. ctClB2]